MTLAKPSNLTDLVCDLRQQLNLSQERFAAKLGVSFKSVNRWENGRAVPSAMALKLLEDLLRSQGESGKVLLNRYFPDSESCQDA